MIFLGNIITTAFGEVLPDRSGNLESMALTSRAILLADYVFTGPGIAALLIVIVITTAEALPPKWTGILAGFPTTLLPTFLILHLTYGPEQTHAMMRSFPIGMVSILLFILSVSVTFPQWGVYGGTAASLSVSLAYITIVVLLGFASTQKSQ